jgi:negative regulator of flagellin synthesis FlgM
MSDISTIGGPASTATIREFVNQAVRSGNQLAELPGDQVEFSEMARFLSRVSELPDVRVEKIASVRSAIDRGDYETPEKLEIAIDRLLATL